MVKLTAKEEEVMEWIWQLGPCSPKDVLAQYDEPRPHINTIATAFQTLEKKGYLTHRAQGRGYIYEPTVEQETYGRSKLSTFVNRYFGNSYMRVVSAFVHEEKVSEGELLQFLADLKKKEQP
ncbi:MAG: BlaI/MecI/CopY family transcriptional regulator [Bacteroidaceae bacterium]|nr:BlaI/MecI/CopY family transcriptional regulator [Bacteroidaceae bacterium]